MNSWISRDLQLAGSHPQQWWHHHNQLGKFWSWPWTCNQGTLTTPMILLTAAHHQRSWTFWFMVNQYQPLMNHYLTIKYHYYHYLPLLMDHYLPLLSTTSTASHHHDPCSSQHVSLLLQFSQLLLRVHQLVAALQQLGLEILQFLVLLSGELIIGWLLAVLVVLLSNG